MTFCIGITGGIGSGKSTFTKFLSEFGGFPVIDADAIAHELTAPNGAAMPMITATFSQEYVSIDGALNRSKMRELIFVNKLQKFKLESIVHPLIRQSIDAKVHHYSGTTDFLLLDIPLILKDSYWQKMLHSVILIESEKSTQIDRVMRRSNLSFNEAAVIIESQVGRFDRQHESDFIIMNSRSSTLRTLQKSAEAIKKLLDQRFRCNTKNLKVIS